MIIKDGFCALVKVDFEIDNVNTWLSFLVRFFINLWNRIKKEELCPYNHVVYFGEENGRIFVYQSISTGFKRTHSLEDWLKGKDPNDILILQPKFVMNHNTAKEKVKDLLDTPYDFIGTMFHQLIRQLTDGEVWIGRKKEKAQKRMYCSEIIALIYNVSTVSSPVQVFQEYYKTDPEDIYKSNLFYKIKL